MGYVHPTKDRMDTGTPLRRFRESNNHGSVPLGGVSFARVLCLLLALFCCGWGVATANASVSLLLEQPYGELGTFNPTGHSAVYFDHICAATPVKLRACRPGELGVVISRYDGIGDFDWIAVPLIPYLYAVDSTSEIPDTIDRLTVLRLRDVYRRQNLDRVAPDTPAGGMPQGNWYQLVGSSYDRTIYGFRVKTTPEQDAAMIALFNDRPNVSRYSGAFRNCADFVRVTINRLYPHAIRRNFIADLGLTTPKSVARGLTHYARKHPDTDLEVFRIPQVESDLPRSMGVEGVTESLIKRYGLPMMIVSPHITAAVLVAYVGHGRFAVPKHAPVLDVPGLEAAAELLATADAEQGETAAAGTQRGLLSGGSFPAVPDDLRSTFIRTSECPQCGSSDVLR